MKSKRTASRGVLIGEMILLQHRLQRIRQSHARTTELLFDMEKKLATLLAPHQAKKR